MEIFTHSDYRKLLDILLKTPVRGGGKGAQTRLAQHLGCQQAFISRVISDKAELSQDQAFLVGEFFKFTHLEREYWLNLVFENRAARASLKKYYKEKLSKIREENSSLNKSIHVDRKITEVEKSFYYSDWYYQAIHMICGLPGRHSISSLAGRLALDESLVIQALEHLVASGLIKRKDGLYQISDGRIHLPPEHPLIRRQHTNWRLQSILRMTKAEEKDLRYTSVATCSTQDAERIRSLIVKTVLEIREIVKNSKDEVALFYGLDLFQI